MDGAHTALCNGGPEIKPPAMLNLDCGSIGDGLAALNAQPDTSIDIMPSHVVRDAKLARFDIVPDRRAEIVGRDFHAALSSNEHLMAEWTLNPLTQLFLGDTTESTAGRAFSFNHDENSIRSSLAIAVLLVATNIPKQVDGVSQYFSSNRSGESRFQEATLAAKVGSPRMPEGWSELDIEKRYPP